MSRIVRITGAKKVGSRCVEARVGNERLVTRQGIGGHYHYAEFRLDVSRTRELFGIEARAVFMAAERAATIGRDVEVYL